MSKPSIPNAAAQLAKRRWSPEARAKSAPAGRKRSDKPRCPCGQYTAHTAGLRRHVCMATPVAGAHETL